MWRMDDMHLIKPSPQNNPRIHKTTLFVLRGAQRRRAAAQDNARHLLRDIGVTALKRIV
jgi:hypothetical protein